MIYKEKQMIYKEKQTLINNYGTDEGFTKEYDVKVNY